MNLTNKGKFSNDTKKQLQSNFLSLIKENVMNDLKDEGLQLNYKEYDSIEKQIIESFNGKDNEMLKENKKMITEINDVTLDDITTIKESDEDNHIEDLTESQVFDKLYKYITESYKKESRSDIKESSGDSFIIEMKEKYPFLWNKLQNVDLQNIYGKINKGFDETIKQVFDLNLSDEYTRQDFLYTLELKNQISDLSNFLKESEKSEDNVMNKYYTYNYIVENPEESLTEINGYPTFAKIYDNSENLIDKWEFIAEGVNKSRFDFWKRNDKEYIIIVLIGDYLLKQFTVDYNTMRLFWWFDYQGISIGDWTKVIIENKEESIKILGEAKYNTIVEYENYPIVNVLEQIQDNTIRVKNVGRFKYIKESKLNNNKTKIKETSNRRLKTKMSILDRKRRKYIKESLDKMNKKLLKENEIPQSGFGDDALNNPNLYDDYEEYDNEIPQSGFGDDALNNPNLYDEHDIDSSNDENVITEQEEDESGIDELFDEEPKKDQKKDKEPKEDKPDSKPKDKQDNLGLDKDQKKDKEPKEDKKETKDKDTKEDELIKKVKELRPELKSKDVKVKMDKKLTGPVNGFTFEVVDDKNKSVSNFIVIETGPKQEKKEENPEDKVAGSVEESSLFESRRRKGKRILKEDSLGSVVDSLEDVDTSNDDELSTAVKNIQQIVNDFVNSQTSKLKQGIEKIGTGNSDDVKMAGQQEDDRTSENRLQDTSDGNDGQSETDGSNGQSETDGNDGQSETDGNDGQSKKQADASLDDFLSDLGDEEPNEKPNDKETETESIDSDDDMLFEGIFDDDDDLIESDDGTLQDESTEQYLKESFFRIFEINPTKQQVKKTTSPKDYLPKGQEKQTQDYIGNVEMKFPTENTKQKSKEKKMEKAMIDLNEIF